MTITDAELADIRAEQAKYMPNEVIIKRKTYTGGEYGAGDFTLETLATEVKARLTPGFGVFRPVADRFQGVNPYTVTVPWDQDIRVGDVVIDEDSVSYEVRSVRNRSSYQTATQTLCDRIK